MKIKKLKNDVKEFSNKHKRIIVSIITITGGVATMLFIKRQFVGSIVKAQDFGFKSGAITAAEAFDKAAINLKIDNELHKQLAEEASNIYKQQVKTSIWSNILKK